jgi:hypothetical protein
VGPSPGFDMCGKFRPHGIGSPERPTCRQSLYRLSYPARSQYLTWSYSFIFSRLQLSYFKNIFVKFSRDLLAVLCFDFALHSFGETWTGTLVF